MRGSNTPTSDESWGANAAMALSKPLTSDASTFVSSANQIEEFRLNDGSKVLASEVSGLLSAMAAFAPLDSSVAGVLDPRMHIPTMPNFAASALM